MNMNFSTASMASPSTIGSQPEAAAPLPASSLPGDSVAAPAATALPSPLFALALNSAMSAAVAQDQTVPGTETDAPPAPKAADTDADAGAPADIAQAATQPEAALPAMAIPMMPMMPLMPPPAPVAPQAAAAPGPATGAATATATATDASVATRQENGQPNLAVNSSLHADAVAFNVQTASLAPRRAASEPIAAAAQGALPSSAFQATLAATTATAASAAPVTAPVAAAAPAPARDGERGAAPAPGAVTPAAGQVSGMANAVNVTPGNDTIKLNGPAQQWQEPLREAMGERLQTQIGRNSEHATIRIEPPMLGRIDISIRHAAGALQVNVTASNPEVLRQLQGIGETMRSDLAQRQYTDVAVNISATPRSPAAQAFAEGDARGQRQPGRQNDDAEPGRALSDGNTAAATYAMPEREMT